MFMPDFPNVVMEKLKIGLYMIGAQSWAWYNPETNTIHVLEETTPKWLAILHECGHWLIGYAPDWLHRRVALDSEYDNLWVWLGLNQFIDIIV